MGVRITDPGQLQLTLEALWFLFKADVLAKASFSGFRRQLNMALAGNAGENGDDAINAMRVAVDRACRYYPKPPACLQRSVALASMLRKRGIPADVQIGIRQSPFASHAWVEVDGSVVNDLPAVREDYPTLHEFRPATPSIGESTSQK
jgi:hypothetical protein